MPAAWILGLLVLAVLGPAAPAAAHSHLHHSDPADGSRTAAVPAGIRLVFSQDVLALGARLRVTGPAGDVADGRPAVAGTEVRQRLRPGAAAGRYTVLWRVTSADGHPLSGRFSFTAGTEAGDAVGDAAGDAAGDEAGERAADQQAAAGATGGGSSGSDHAGGGHGSSGGHQVWPQVVLAIVIAGTAIVTTARGRRGRAQSEPPAVSPT